MPFALVAHHKVIKKTLYYTLRPMPLFKKSGRRLLHCQAYQLDCRTHDLSGTQQEQVRIAMLFPCSQLFGLDANPVYSPRSCERNSILR